MQGICPPPALTKTFRKPILDSRSSAEEQLPERLNAPHEGASLYIQEKLMLPSELNAYCPNCKTRSYFEPMWRVELQETPEPNELFATASCAAEVVCKRCKHKFEYVGIASIKANIVQPEEKAVPPGTQFDIPY